MNKTNHYDTIIIGFGKGGKTLAGVLGNSGKKTALIEKSPVMYGGTCINVGCIPTKFLVHRARDAKFAEDKAAYYKEAVEKTDWDKVDKSELVDLRDVKIDRNLPEFQRIISYVNQVKNPYCFKV